MAFLRALLLLIVSETAWGVGIQVDASLTRHLHDVSAGWAAGVSLIVERMRRGFTDAAAIAPDSLEDVFDYFAGQIHDRTSPEIQQILLKLAFFPRLTPEHVGHQCPRFITR